MGVSLSQLNKLAELGKLEGFMRGIDNDIYHKGPGHSSSGISTIKDYSLAWYAASKELPQEEADHLTFGNAFHVFVLEPGLVREKITFYPEECTGRSKAAKEERELFDKANAEKYILKNQEEYDLLGKMALSVNKFLIKSEVPDLLSGGEAETSAYYKHPEFDILLKCRPDYFHKKIGLAINLKTAASIKERDFQSSIMEYGYHIASAFYTDVLSAALGKKVTEIHLCVEKKSPFRVGICYLDEGSIEKGREIYREILSQISEAESSNVWKGMKSIAIPHWGF